LLDFRALRAIYNKKYVILHDMNFLESLKQLKAFARQDGAILALVWIAAFLFTMRLPQSMVGNLLTLSTPFVVAWRLRAFRNNALDGEISYRRALAYSWHTFVYASLIFALAQYLYIRFYDPESLITMMRDSIHSFGAAYQQMGMNETQMQESVKLLGTLQPIELVFLFFTQNIFIGLFLSLIIAAFGMKHRR